MSSWTDVLFALVCGTLGELAVRTISRARRVAALIRGAFLAFFAICALYSVAAIGLFHYFNRPITFELLGLIGNAAVVRSSIIDRISVPVAIGMVLVPIAFLVLVRWGGWKPRGTAIAVGAALLWIGAGSALHRARWDEHYVTHIWLNPHTELLRTAVVRLAGGHRPKFPRDFPPEDVNEFRSIGARGNAAEQNFFQPPAGEARPKNVILVILESVGTKYLRLYGSPLDVMPKLEAEARNALVFDNIYAHASFTYCSFRTLNFSLYPGLPWHYAALGDARPFPETLATKLRSRGFRTAYLSNGNLDWEDERWLLEASNGFETIDDYGEVGCRPLSSWGTEDRCLFERLIRWIDEKPGQPFFAICWTDQTHDPYQLGPGVTPIDFFAGQPRPPFAKDLSAYLNVVHETDRQLGIVFEALRARGLADDTLVIVTGDHGEAFADPHSQRGHSWSVFEEEVRVPLLLWNPRLFAGQARGTIIGGHVDVNPTIADILGIEPDGAWQGQSLFDPAKPNRAYFLAIAGGDVFGVREGNLKYIYDVTSGTESLFNLESDPLELSAIDEPATVQRLRQRVAAWVTFEDAFLWEHEN